ncbi:MAG: molybdopterin oxidoreductase [Hyphomicrobiaceae bacterium]
MTQTIPRFMQGTFNFKGIGIDNPIPIQSLRYEVPAQSRSKVVYFRAGNSSDDVVNLTLLRDGSTMRLFPLGMKSSMHFPLAIQELLPPATKLDVVLGAPEGLTGSIFVDIGLIEELIAP